MERGPPFRLPVTEIARHQPAGAGLNEFANADDPCLTKLAELALSPG